MNFEEKLAQLTRAMSDYGLDLVVIPPSGDMNFLIGFDPGGCERFQAVFVTREGKIFCITNLLYAEDMKNALPGGTPLYTWDDADCFETAVAEGFRVHGIRDAVIGVNDAVRAVDLMALTALLPGCRFREASSLLSDLRIIKTPEQLDFMREAGKLADRVMEELKTFIKPGMTERDIKNRILDSFAALGAAPSFTPIVASGPNSSRPHYNRDDRVIADGDAIVLDFGCKFKGFCSDTSRTYFVGEPSPRMKSIYGIVKAAFEAAAATAARGVTAGEVDRAARQVIRDAGFGDCFINRTGHGIGMDVHEAPFIRGGSDLVLEKGMAFSIEPGIYVPGEVGMRIEDIFIINMDGRGESVNASNRDLTVL